MKQVRVPDEIEVLAKQTVHAAFTVHRALGPGLLESAYQQCLGIELGLAGLTVEREKLLPLVYRGHAIETAYRLDLIIGGKLLVELKTVETVAPIQRAADQRWDLPNSKPRFPSRGCSAHARPHEERGQSDGSNLAP